jgi:hypothetical protein
MANTTFTGPVISTNGFQATPIALTDASVTLTRLANGGRVNVIPAVSANRTITLPTPVAGTSFTFIYGGAAEETENVIFDTGSDTNFFIGGVQHLDTNADNVSVYSDGNSNSILTLIDFGIMEINIIAKDSTNWYVWGNVISATAPTFADQ